MNLWLHTKLYTCMECVRAVSTTRRMPIINLSVLSGL